MGGASPQGTWEPPPGRGGAAQGGLRAELGQGLALGVIFLSMVLLLMLLVPGLAIAYADRAELQSAADAAALACAGRTVVTDLVDARGDVYARTVIVDGVAGPWAAAQAWADNLTRWPVHTLSFLATVRQAHCTVSVAVRAAVPLLRLMGRPEGGLVLRVVSEARALPVAGRGGTPVADGG